MTKLNASELQEKLSRDVPSAWEKVDEAEKEKAFAISENYRAFLSHCKTERACNEYFVKEARNRGFVDLYQWPQDQPLKPGDKVYVDHQNKAVLLFVIGEQPLSNGLNIIGGHIDSPRLDLKPNPLYEECDLAFLKTHYYGGIKKYQWVTIPLALHGVVIKKNGERVDVAIGEKPEDPVFVITDLLPHLAQEQMQKKMSKGIEGEGLNLLVGNIPYGDDEIKEPVKLAILEHLHQTYGIVEEDFVSAELEAVPAGAARDVGFDRSIIGGYGQDDRVCSYTAALALFSITETVERTSCVILADKEEIGSYGSTGMMSKYFEYAVAELAYLSGEALPESALRRGFMQSDALSADVNSAFDPNYTGTHDLKNASYAGKGVTISKYGGARGKSGSNDAHAEFMAGLRSCFDEANVAWQTGDLGKVDLGGGGTIAWMMAQYGMNVVDCGPALLSMHAPFELCTKIDIYMTYKAYRAFLLNYRKLQITTNKSS